MSELVAQNVLKSNTYHCTLQYICSILSLCSLLQQCCESLPIIYSISERNVSPLHLPFIKKTEGNALFHKTHQCGSQLHMHENDGWIELFCLIVGDALVYSCQCCFQQFSALCASQKLGIQARLCDVVALFQHLERTCY